MMLHSAVKRLYVHAQQRRLFVMRNVRRVRPWAARYLRTARAARLRTATATMMSLAVLLAACGQSASHKDNPAVHRHRDANSTETVRPLSSISVSSVNTSIPGFQNLVAVQGPEAEAALSAWYAKWIAFDQAMRTMDWNYPPFVRYEGSAQLASTQKWMQNAKARGYIGVGNNQIVWAMVTSISSKKLTSGPNGGALPQNNPLASTVVTSAVVKACIAAGQTPVKATTGKPMPGFGLGVVAEYITSTMIQEGNQPWEDLIDRATERNTKQCEK